MTLKTFIRDGRGTGNLAGVSPAGEIVIVGYGRNLSQFQNMNVNNTAFNFFQPISGNEFNITSIIATITKAATLSIFAAPSTTSTTVDTQLLQITVSASTVVPITFPLGGFLPVSEGEFLNATIDVQPALVTIIGFYRPKYEPDIFATVKR